MAPRSNHKASMTPEQLRQFIEIYRDLPCLWKTKSLDYSNKHKKEAGYEKLAEYCRTFYPQANVIYVKSKIANLRTVFKKEEHKMEASKRSGVGPDQLYVPKLWYYDLLSFVRDQDIPKESHATSEEDICELQVTCEPEDSYDSQTNLQFNNNKYYLIQLLEDDSAKNFSVWMRWGRVGKVGQNSLVSCGGDLQKAKDIFQKKFFDKTKNSWSERGDFEKVPGKYDMLHMDYNQTTQEEKNVVEVDKPSDIPKPESKLDLSVQDLIQLICNMQNMEETVLEMKYDTKKAPLGKLTVEQIRAGYSSLQRIENCIKAEKFGKQLLEACNEFYTRIPHDFGLRTPPLIRTVDELTLKVRLLEALGDIQIAVKLASMDLNSHEHPLDRKYRQINCSLEPLNKTSDEFQLIECYLKTTHASTHNDYTMTLMNVFRVNKEGEESNFQSELHNRMLLWHGSRLSNWVGILSQGLRVAPPEAPVTGYMFGKGIYFADVSSKSANYCFTTRDKNVGILLLSEVALGDCNELIAADYDAQKKLKGKHSTKGVGRSIPDPQKSVTHEGAQVPLGPLIDTGLQNRSGYTLNYNEYIVYDPSQVRMKYLLQVGFNYESLW